MSEIGKYTPGPWTFAPYRAEPPNYHILAEGNEDSIAMVWGNIHRANVLANARLIAAAPEMIEALQKAQRVMKINRLFFENAGLWKEADKAINFAIAKAEGRE